MGRESISQCARSLECVKQTGGNNQKFTTLALLYYGRHGPKGKAMGNGHRPVMRSLTCNQITEVENSSSSEPNNTPGVSGGECHCSDETY